MTRDEAVRAIFSAGTPQELFGADGARGYRRLARLVHPDAGGPAEAFHRLTVLWRASTTVTLTTSRNSYALAPSPIRGDLANLYDAGDVLVKIPCDPGTSDLMEREAVALRGLAGRGDARFQPYVPVLAESFWHRDEVTGVRRRVNALGRLDGFHSLAEVQAAYPDGVDPRDAAWMWRRLLVALGFAHRAGVLHGGVLPEHVLIHPAEHGLVLVDWCYAVTEEHPGRVPAIVGRHTDLYPLEVLARRPAAPGTDVFMATRCMALLMGDRAPRSLRLFARGCLPSNQRRRPQDAWRLLAELDEVLERLYGRRRFRLFTLPGADVRRSTRREHHDGKR